MRPNVFDRLQVDADELHATQGVSVSLINDELVGRSVDWSEPFQLRMERREGGIVEIFFKRPEDES